MFKKMCAGGCPCIPKWARRVMSLGCFVHIPFYGTFKMFERSFMDLMSAYILPYRSFNNLKLLE